MMIMKKIHFAISAVVMVLLLILISCTQNREKTLLDGNNLANNGNIPEPKIVPSTDIPRPYSKSTYFLYGGEGALELELAQGNVALILEKLLEENFAIKEAWNAAGEWGCPLRKPTWEQLILRLDTPDQRLYRYGFTSDSSRVQIFENPPCRPTWEYYRF